MVIQGIVWASLGLHLLFAAALLPLAALGASRGGLRRGLPLGGIAVLAGVSPLIDVARTWLVYREYAPAGWMPIGPERAVQHLIVTLGLFLVALAVVLQPAPLPEDSAFD